MVDTYAAETCSCCGFAILKVVCRRITSLLSRKTEVFDNLPALKTSLNFTFSSYFTELIQNIFICIFYRLV